MRLLKTYTSIFLLLLTLSIAAFQQFQNLGAIEIKIWDEARGAVNAIEMMQNGDYAVVRFDDKPDHWNTKTPFFIWFKVAAYKIFGINEFAVRVPTAFFTFLIVFLLLYFSWRYLKEIYTGALASIIIVNVAGFMGYHVARNGEPDVMLTFFVLFYSLIWFLLLEYYPQRRNVLFLLFGAGVLAAVYTKNIAGLSPLLGIFLYTLFRYKLLFQILRDFRLYLSIFIVLLFIALHFFVREHYDPGYSQLVFQREIYGMFVDYVLGEPKHPEFWFYFNYLEKLGFAVFLYFIPIGILPLVFSKNVLRKRLIVLSYLMLLAIFFGYSSSEAKNEWYIAPIYPFMALIIAISFYELLMIIKRITNKYLKISLYFILIGLLTWQLIAKGEITFKRNKPHAQIYGPEQMGYCFKHFKAQHPEIKTFTILTTKPLIEDRPELDQIKFYTKRQFLLDSTQTRFYNKIDSTLIGKNVLTCEPKFINEIQVNFDYDSIAQNKYGILYHLKGLSKRNFVNYCFSNSWEPIKTNESKRLLLPDSVDVKSIVGFDILGTCDTVLAWTEGGIVYKMVLGQNTITHFEYQLPDGLEKKDLLAIAVNGNSGEVYSFYRNNSLWKGTISNLGVKEFEFVMPQGLVASDVLHAAIQNKGDKTIVFVWLANKRLHKVLLTTPRLDLSKTIEAFKFNLPNTVTIESIYGMGIGGKKNNVLSIYK